MDFKNRYLVFRDWSQSRWVASIVGRVHLVWVYTDCSGLCSEHNRKNYGSVTAVGIRCLAVSPCMLTCQIDNHVFNQYTFLFYSDLLKSIKSNYRSSQYKKYKSWLLDRVALTLDHNTVDSRYLQFAYLE